MKISIRRHGIVIKTIEVKGEKARIGSGEDCEIRLDDPYLASSVGELVRKGNEWHIVDPATSLEGITREGRRIDDEPVNFGSVYSVGGFELVAEGARAGAAQAAPAGVPKTVFEGAMPREEIPRTIYEGKIPESEIPRTVFEAPLPESSVPKTVFEQPLPPSASKPVPKTVFEAPMPPPPHAAPPGGLDFRPVQPAQPHAPAGAQPAAPAAAHPAAPVAAGGRRKRLLLIGGLAFILVILLLVIATRKGAPPARQVAAKTPATTTSAAKPASEVSRPLPSAEALAGDLKVDEAMLAWQIRLEKAPDPALQRRYADSALEIGMVHAAAGDSKTAKSWFERAAKYGPADSDSVKAAKEKLETLR